MPELLLKAKPEADVVTLPSRLVLAYEGKGAPEGEAFQKGVKALYGVAYGLKFARKAHHEDFKLGPLEARWWASAGVKDSAKVPPRDTWRWQLRLAVPDDLEEAELADAIHTATHRKGGKLEHSAEAELVRLERIPAQTVGRALHIGPYSEEKHTFARIEQALAAAKAKPARSHLEIYLSNPSRTQPDKLKTILLRETQIALT